MSMQPSAPAPAQTCSNGTSWRSASASWRRYAPPSGYRLSSSDARSIASSAAGNGGNGPSFDASLTTRSRPSSRWTSSTGFPGWYGVSPVTAARKSSALMLSIVERPRLGCLAPLVRGPKQLRHQDRVEARSVGPAVVGAAAAFAAVAELLVQRDRGGVVGKDVQLQLLDADVSRPLLGREHQRPPGAAPPVCARDHQAEICDVAARRMRVAGDGEPADDRAVVLRDEHHRVGMPAQRAQIPALAGDAPPGRRGQQPSLRLRGHLVRERDERRGVARLGRADNRSHVPTTAAAPPRRGSPAAASPPSGRTSTAAAPPKKRLRRRQRTTSYPRISSRSRTSAG